MSKLKILFRVWWTRNLLEAPRQTWFQYLPKFLIFFKCSKLVEIAGTEAEKYMFICLFESIDFKDPKIQNGTKDLAKTQFLSQHLTIYSSQSAFLDYFAQVCLFSSLFLTKQRLLKQHAKNKPSASISAILASASN